ncbi:MAG: hypothetical protein J5854_07595 [Clostridia bacterium]|nr:hypothetical protein [Clostridia bacterium]
MKKLFKILCVLAVAMMLVPFAGCLKDPNGPTVVDIKTPVPTEAPVPADAETVDAFFGDWYGVYTVKSATGIYAANSGVKNDCAMRAAIYETGTGSCYLAVNGLEPDAVSGSKNVFALCTAIIANGELVIKGMINRFPAEWRFRREGALLKLSESFGDEANGMQIEIVLARPDALADSGIAADAAEYLAEYGFSGVIDAIGGRTSELPTLMPNDGYDAHDFFTAEPTGSVADPLPTGGKIVTGANGHITLDVPENYVVMQNDVLGFVLSAPQDRVSSVEFTFASTTEDALSYLITAAPGAKEFTHYTIDGFDFYGAFIDGPQGFERSTVYKLCGVSARGDLVVITMTMTRDLEAAKTYASALNDTFRQLILGAKFN